LQREATNRLRLEEASMIRVLRRLWKWLRGKGRSKEPPVWHADPDEDPASEERKRPPKTGADAGHGTRPDGDPEVPGWEEEIPRPPEAEREPFVDVEEPPAPPVRKRIRLRPTGAGGNPEMFRVRLRVAAVLFGMVGQDYLPGRLVARLRNQDPFEAVEGFLHSLGTSFDQLLQDVAAREGLARGIEALAELDALRIEASLPDDPLYEALAARDYRRIKELHTRLEALARLTVDARAIDPVFPAFRLEFLGPFHLMMAEWSTVDPSVLTEARESLDAWAQLHTAYRDVKAELGRLLAEILSHPLALEDEERELARRMGIRAAAVDRDARSGSAIPADATSELAAILEDARRCWREIGKKRHDERKEPPRSGFQAWVAILGLSEEDDLTLARVKTAFRARAMETHPDHGGSSEAFRAVYDAFTRLKEYLSDRDEP